MTRSILLVSFFILQFAVVALAQPTPPATPPDATEGPIDGGDAGETCELTDIQINEIVDGVFLPQDEEDEDSIPDLIPGLDSPVYLDRECTRERIIDILKGVLDGDDLNCECKRKVLDEIIRRLIEIRSQQTRPEIIAQINRIINELRDYVCPPIRSFPQPRPMGGL